ncbi:MAG: acyltransferase, partial [Ilumatobacter sp.]|nr:acyltransferase [Ilumatobacter sp.]
YLITLLLIAEKEQQGVVSLKNFWIRRFRRLLPALFLMLLLLAIWTALFERDALGKLRGDVIAGLAYGTNWYQIFIGAGYSAANDFAPLRHLWSLAVEEQFYLIWPVVMLVLLRNGSRKVADLSKWLFGVAVLITVVVAVLYHGGPINANPENSPAAYWELGGRSISKADALYLSTITRAGGLMLGAAFAMIWRPRAVMRGPLRHRARTLDVAALVGFVVLAVFSWKVGFINTSGDNRADPWLFNGGFFVAGIATLLMIAAVTHRESLTSRALSGPTLLWIGTRSYGLYLYHWPIYQIVRNTAGTKLLFHEWVLCMVATVIITEISYRYLETPIRRGALGRMWSRREFPLRRAGNRGAVLGGAFVGTALAIYASASLATAELKQNEVAEDLRRGAEETCSVLEGNCFDAPAVAGDDAAPLGADGLVPETTAVVADGAAPVTEPPATPAPAAAPDKLAIGDSVMLGAADELVAAGYVVDAEESRSFGKGIDIVQALVDSGQVPNQLVIHLGTNGPINSGQVDQMITLLASVPEVVLVRNDVDRDYAATNNELMTGASAAHPNIHVLYWDGLASQCQGDCIYQDGIHLKSTGAAYYVQLIDGVFAAN